MTTYTQDPNANLDYGFDWQDWLAAGETIVTSTWVAAAGLTKGASTNNTTSTTVWLSSGTDGRNYLVTNRIVTSAGRTEERSFTVQCRQR